MPQDRSQSGYEPDERLNGAAIEAGVRAFAHELPEVEETMSNAESAALVTAICGAVLAKIDGRA